MWAVWSAVREEAGALLLQDCWNTLPQCSQAAHPCGNMSQMRCPTSSVKQVRTEIFLGTGECVQSVKHTSSHQKLATNQVEAEVTCLRVLLSRGCEAYRLCVELGPQLGGGLVGSLYSTAVRRNLALCHCPVTNFCFYNQGFKLKTLPSQPPGSGASGSHHVPLIKGFVVLFFVWWCVKQMLILVGFPVCSVMQTS